MNRNKGSLLAPLIKRSLGAVVYFDGGEYVFSKRDNAQGLDARNNNGIIPVLVAARKHYSEIIRTYPVEQKKEVANLVKLEFEGTRFFYQILDTEKGKTNVNVWVFDEVVPNALITLPETAVLAATLDDNEVLRYSRSKDIFLTKNNKGIFSQNISPLINSEGAFLLSVGLSSENILFKQLTAEQFAENLQSGLSKLPVNTYLRFASATGVWQANSSKVYKFFALPMAVMFGLYLSVSSMYLVWQEYELESELALLDDSVDSLFRMQEQLEKGSAELQLLSQFSHEQVEVANFWFVMASLFPEATLTRVAYTQGRFVIAGESEKATGIFEVLNGLEWVGDARFDSPTRKSRFGERFLISFVLVQSNEKADS